MRFARYAPALAVALAAPAAMFGDWAAAQMSEYHHSDYGTVRGLTILALGVGAIIAFAAAKLDRFSFWILIAAGLSGAWMAFLLPGSRGGGGGVLGIGLFLLWFVTALAAIAAIFPLRWLQWLTLIPLAFAGAACALWLGHELIYVYGPMLVR